MKVLSPEMVRMFHDIRLKQYWFLSVLGLKHILDF